jgi:peptidyl-prolyl isomerase E (cyclophilin E)
MDYVKGKHRGFGFCEFEYMEDATECIFNMDGADLMGRTISVNLAQANQVNLTTSTTSQQAIWSTDEWFQEHVVGSGNSNDHQNSEEHKIKLLDQDELKS